MKNKYVGPLLGMVNIPKFPIYRDFLIYRDFRYFTVSVIRSLRYLIHVHDILKY